MKIGETLRDIGKKLYVNNKLLGKSWLTAVYIVTRCILYPNTKIVIASGQLSQACEVLEYVDKLRLGSDAIDKEIRFLSTNKANAKCDFWNGSSIRIVASTEGSRGKRANLLIVDEHSSRYIEIYTRNRGKSVKAK